MARGMLAHGVDIGAYATKADKSYAFMGTRERSSRGRLMVNEIADPEDEEVELIPLDPAIAQKIALLAKGAGESFFYLASTSTTGSKGTVPNAGGTYTPTATDGPFTNCRLQVGSASFIEIPTGAIGQGNWTIRLLKYETIADDGAASDAWYRYIVIGSGTTVDGWWRNGTASGLATPDNWLSMASDGDLQLEGKDSDATNNAKYYSSVEIVPYQIETDWADDVDIDVNGHAPPGLPFFYLWDYNADGFEPGGGSFVVAGRCASAGRMKWGGAYRRLLRLLFQHQTSAT